MSTRIYISKNEKSQAGFKKAKDRLALLMGEDASDNMKLKLIFVYRSENPRALIKDLPVIWKSNKKPWVTKQLFQDWFLNYFCSACINFEILLVLDNALGDSSNLNKLNENITVLYFPTQYYLINLTNGSRLYHYV